LEQAVLQKVQSEVDYQQDQLVHAAMVAMAAATDLTPTMVRQYIERKKLGEGVLAKQKAEAEARLQQVVQDQQRGTMRSPVDGVVLSRFISNERYLSAGTAILEIGRLEDMEVEADILTLDAVAAKVGDEVEIYGPAIGKPSARGKVTRIFPAGFTKISSLGVEQQRVKVIIRFAEEDLRRLLDQRGLGADYRVRVRIFTAENRQALIIPRSTLFRAADNRWQVFAVRNGAARIQTVEVGLMNDEQVEIEKGLKEGDLVIIAPESNLADGTRVSANVAEK
jgi:HlyD family secretion protein